MKVPFRQGIIRYQKDTSNNPLFLQKSTSGNNITLYVSPDPTLLCLIHGTTDYLFEERRTVENAWGPFITGRDYWLFWDIHLVTGIRTFGSTEHEPIISNSKPINPPRDTHWFNTMTNIMLVWDGMAWIERIRLFACKYVNGSIIQSFTHNSQVNLNQETSAGFILFDEDEKPVKKYKINNVGQFLTTESKLITHASKIANIRLESSSLFAEAIENIPAWSVVAYKGVNQLGLASHNDVLHSAVGVCVESLFATEVGGFISNGYITNLEWNWTQPTSTPLFVGGNGEITTIVPQIGSIQQIGIVISPDTILVRIEPQIILYNA